MKTALALATLLATTNAFVPAPPSASSTKTTSFVPTSQQALFPKQSLPPMSPYSSSSARQATALQANLLERFFKVAQSNVLNVVKNLEAPEKIMNQAMMDMQNDLMKVRQSYAEISAQQKRLMKQREAAESRAEDWYVRAQLALRNGSDALAKEALYRRQQQMESIRALQTQIDTQSAAADKLYQGMRALEDKIKEASQRKNEFIARAKAAESTQKVNDMLSGMTGQTSMDAFRRMEEKVEALEAAAEASAEMANLATSYLPSSSSDVSAGLTFEDEFRLLESNQAVDEEFNKLKTKLLTSSTSNKVYSSSIENEFSKLKQESSVKIPVMKSSDT